MREQRCWGWKAVEAWRGGARQGAARHGRLKRSADQIEQELARLHQLNAIFAIFGASDRDKSLDLKGRGLRNRL